MTICPGANDCYAPSVRQRGLWRNSQICILRVTDSFARNATPRRSPAGDDAIKNPRHADGLESAAFPRRTAESKIFGRGLLADRRRHPTRGSRQLVTDMALKLAKTTPTADLLADFELFRDLPSDALAALARRCQWRRYRAHQVILGHRDDSREVFCIVRGQVRVTFFAECGREVSFRDLPAGEMFGELSAIDGLPRSCTVVALTEAMVAVMPARVFWDLLRAYESVNAGILRRLTRLVRSLSHRVVESSTLTVRKRVQAELLRLARETAPGQKCAVIFPAPTHAELASRVSTHREAVTRGLGELARAGIIEKRGGTLVIRDVDGLAAMVNEVLSE
jgi:CRP/FNR family transcriptional regulator, cyclic AMP receptor protein